MATVKRNTVKFDAAMKEIVGKLTNASTVRVGFPADATYNDGTPVALVAAVQEFGAPSRNIPPRPFMRGTVNEHSGEWARFLEKQIVANDYDAAKTLGQLGEGIKGQLIDAITNFSDPPNAPSTLKKKQQRSTSPLQDTGHMRNSIAVEVE